MKQYFEKLKDLREDNDMTQKEIANYLGIDQSYYSKYERGVDKIPIRQIKKLAELYKIKIDEII